MTNDYELQNFLLSTVNQEFTLTCGVSSVMGIFSGSPNVAHVLEYIKVSTPCLAIDSNTTKVFDVMLW